MSYRFACALLASFLFGFAAVHLQPESPSRERAVDAAHRLPPGEMHSKVAAAAKPAYPLSRLEEETRHSAAFNDLWVRRTSLSADEPRQRLGLDAVDDGAAPLTDSETAAAPVDAQGNGNADGNDPQTQLKSANNAGTRIYILYGQYGFPTSSGMYGLAQNLGRYGKVTLHYWDDRTIVGDAKQQSGKIVIIGYSLGANSAALIARRLPRVDLVVAYDPSRLSPLAQPDNGEFTEAVTPSVRRAICFYNRATWYFGGARLVGPQVEIIPINEYHLAVPMNWRLHEITEEAVKKVALESPEPTLDAPISGTENLVISKRTGGAPRGGAAALSPRTKTAAANG